MSSGADRAFYGSFVGTGANIDLLTVGFRPKSVELTNTSGLAEGKWQESQADGTMTKRVTAGAMSLANAGEGITPLASGFRLGPDADLNVVGEIVHFVARG